MYSFMYTRTTKQHGEGG